jgi:hypothetical protein
MEKKCYICDFIKNIDDFYKNQTRCKSCTKKYISENKERIKEYKKSYNSEGKRSKSDKKYYLKNKESLNGKNNLYYLENKEFVKIIQKNYRENNKDYLLLKGREYSRKYYNKNKNNFLFKLKGNCRSMIGNSMRYKGYLKNSKSESILGCAFEDFKLHLESKFEIWMSWNNYGLYNGELNYGWDIDHIIPLDSAETEEDIIKLNHYTNLQPLCSYTNRHIKMYKLTFNI